jgi:hypothetical protein
MPSPAAGPGNWLCRARRFTCRGSTNGLQHRRKVVSDGLVGKAENAVARRHQEAFTLRIVLALLGMGRAIELDGQATIGTAEIDHEWSNRMLAAELQIGKIAIAQCFLEHHQTEWTKKFADNEPRLARLVARSSTGDHLLTILAAFRNTIHGELAALLTYREAAQSHDTWVALPREKATDVLTAMDALEGKAAWGVDQPQPSGTPDTFVRPGPFVEQLLRHATELLDALLASTPVEKLSGVELRPSDLARPAHPSDLLSAQTGQRIRWQLGL